MLDFTEEYTKFEFEKINEELFLNLVTGSDKQFHGMIGKMKLNVSQSDTMTPLEELEITTASEIAKVSSSTPKSSTEAWDISFTYGETTYYMKYSDNYGTFSTGSIKDTPYAQGTYYIETVEGDICVVKGTAENTFRIIPKDANLKFIDPVVIRTEEQDAGAPSFTFDNQLLSLDVETFPEDSFIVDTVNKTDYDHLTIGSSAGKDRFVIFKEDDIITQDYSERIIVFQYYNTDSPDVVYSLKLKSLDDFRKVVIERDTNTQLMTKLTVTLSQSDLSDASNACVISVEFGSDGSISTLKKTIGAGSEESFDESGWMLLNYAYFIEKTDEEGLNNETLIPNSDTTATTINLPALLFGYPIRKVIASYGDNDVEIIRQNDADLSVDFTINTNPFNLPYNTAEDTLNDGSKERVYYCAGNILVNTTYTLNEPDPKYATYNVDKVRTIKENPYYYIFNIKGSATILGDITGKIESFVYTQHPTSIARIYEFKGYNINLVSLTRPGKSNLPIGNNYEFIFRDTVVGYGDKTITDLIGFVVTDYTTEASAAPGDFYKGVLAAAKIKCASSPSYGVLFVCEDGYLYWTTDETNKVQIYKVYIKDTILHYGWHKTIECGTVLITHDNAEIKDIFTQANEAAAAESGDDTAKAAAKATKLEELAREMLGKYKYSMIIDQHLKTVLIKELITRDFQRESLNLLYCDFENLVISPVGVFSNVSVDTNGHLYIRGNLQKISDRCFTGTANMKLAYTLFNDDNILSPFDASCMFQNINTASDANASILINAIRMSSTASMFKGAQLTGKQLGVQSQCVNFAGEWIPHNTETTRFDGHCFFEHSAINVPATGITLKFDNYKEYDLTNFFARSTISTLIELADGGLDLLLRINDDSNLSEDKKMAAYYPHVIMSSFLEGAILASSSVTINKLILNFDKIFKNNHYRIFQCDNMFVDVRDTSNDVILRKYGGNITFQAATTDFNPRDIFGLVRPKLIKWLIKSMADDGTLLRIHSH